MKLHKKHRSFINNRSSALRVIDLQFVIKYYNYEKFGIPGNIYKIIKNNLIILNFMLTEADISPIWYSENQLNRTIKKHFHEIS